MMQIFSKNKTGIKHSAKCTFCGSASRTLRPFAFRHSECLDLYKCSTCGCEFLCPSPSGEWLKEEYDNYYSKRSGGIERPKIRYFRNLLSGLGENFDGLRILDIGSAEGEFVSVVNELWPDAQVTAIESNEECSAFYRNLRCTLVKEFFTEWITGVNDNSFDAVFCFDVIEHFTDPAASLQLLLQKIAPRGWVIATFPNCESLSRVVMGRHWFQYKVEHCTYFTRKAIVQFAHKNRMHNKKIGSLWKKMPVDYYLTVGSRFGPDSFRHIAGIVNSLCPPILRNITIPLSLGEWLWIAKKQ